MPRKSIGCSAKKRRSVQKHKFGSEISRGWCRQCDMTVPSKPFAASRLCLGSERSMVLLVNKFCSRGAEDSCDTGEVSASRDVRRQAVTRHVEVFSLLTGSDCLFALLRANNSVWRHLSIWTALLLLLLLLLHCWMCCMCSSPVQSANWLMPWRRHWRSPAR